MKIATKHVKSINQAVAAPNSGDLLQYNASTEQWETSPATDSFSATFDNAVGALTVVVRKHGLLVTLEVPTGSTADGGGVAIASGATEVPAAYRPAADISFLVAVTNNNALVAGKVIITAAGKISFYSSAASAAFTDNAVAGWPRCAVTYSLA